MCKKSVAMMLGLLGAAGVYWLAEAGDLEPPGPPAPTMVTLPQIYDAVKPHSDMCFDNVGRFVVCGNGTVKDNLTGLFWLETADCFEFTSWATASTAVALLANGQCGLTDGSSPGDWRLPTKDEWQTIIDQAISNGCSAPYFPDLVGTGCCGTETCAFSGVGLTDYWASTTSATSPDHAWKGSVIAGWVGTNYKNAGNGFWPVRAGQ
jgi:hypothetical protein